MDTKLFRSFRPLLAAATLAVLLAGCSSSKSPTSSTPIDNTPDRNNERPSTIAPGEPNPATPVTSVEGLVTQLQNLGMDATYQGKSLEQSFFFPAAHIVRINGEDVRVYVYDDVSDLKADAGKISVDGGTLGNTSVRWIAPPHFYARSTYLALYVGVNDEVTGALASIFGPPFAGQGAIGQEVGGPDVVDQYSLEKPALLVAGTPEELDRLQSLLPPNAAKVDLQSVDLTQNWVVAAFRGAMPTAGYGIEIETIYVDADDRVLVEVSLSQPGIDELVAQVITYPVDVKVVARHGLLAPTTVPWVAQTAAGKLLASTGRYEAPTGGPLPVDPMPVDLEPPTLVDIRGTIVTAEFSETEDSDILVRLLIEGAGTDDTLYDTAWVEVIRSTAISFDGETFAPPVVTDLQPGRNVQVRFVGPVRESYPVQAIAGDVLIYR